MTRGIALRSLIISKSEGIILEQKTKKNSVQYASQSLFFIENTPISKIL